MVSGHEAYEMFFGSGKEGESHTWATVDSINDDGTANVLLSPTVATKCTCLCQVLKGDRVLVLVFGQGAVVIGKAV